MAYEILFKYGVDPEVCKNAANNCKVNGNNAFTPYYINKEDPIRTMGNSFLWESSAEGKEYWLKEYDNIKKLEAMWTLLSQE